MKQPRLTERAEADLAEIWLHIASHSSINADRHIQAILGKCDLLAGQPGIGRSRAGFGPGLRSLAFGNYLIFYRRIANGIEVVRVVHGARRLEALFRD